VTTPRHPVDLAELHRRPRRAPWSAWLDGTAVDPFTALERKPRVAAVTLYQFDQERFERLVQRAPSRLRGVYLWKCPRIADLSPLERLPHLTHVASYWNQRATALWDFHRTPRLRGLDLSGFVHLRRLDDLRRATSLTELQLAGLVWSRSCATFASLAPLAALARLRALRLDTVRVLDGDVEPLGGLRALRRLAVPAGTLTLDQLAWLRARLPRVRPADLAPVRRTEPMVHVEGPPWDTLLVGKGTRRAWCNRQRDRARIAAHAAAFERLVERYRRDPSAAPGQTARAPRRAASRGRAAGRGT
jgi:hypothetical protein